MNRGTGIASLNRYFAWGSELRPWPGELEYLDGAELRQASQTAFDTLVRMPPALRLGKSVTDNAYSYARARR
jgi:hypothetical protein